MSTLAALPILVPAVTAALCFLAWRWVAVQRWLGVIGGAAYLAAALALLAAVDREGFLVVRFGAWPAPFGIVFVADMFSAIMVVLTGLMGLAVVVYSLADVGPARQRAGYFGLYHVMLMGVSGAFLTGDLFNLYVWFEVMLIASFVMLTIGGQRDQIEGGLKYVSLNLLSSAIFLAAVGVVYGICHTLNLADLHGRMQQVQTNQPALVMIVATLLLVAFGIKAAVFPLFFWLPASYHTPPAAVSAIFAGLLTKVGVYAIVRVFTLVFSEPTLYQWVLIASGLTMISGVLGAVAQVEVRRVLSFHIISQIGYMILGVGLLLGQDAATRRLGLAAAVFYIAHHIIVKTNLFLIGGTVRAIDGSYKLERLGGLASRRPWLGVLFLIPALSLAGVPPLSGFWAKLGVVRAALETQAYVVVTAALAAGLLTLVSMMKIWNEVFWKPSPAQMRPPTSPPPGLALRLGPSVALALLTVWIGLAPQTLFGWAQTAADQLLHPGRYIQAVGTAPPPGPLHRAIEETTPP